MRSTGRTIVLMLAALCCLAAAGTALAAAGRDYALSIRALQDGKYARAEEKIRDALEDEPQAKESILISGATRYRYVPYYVLGAALRGQGKCPEAIEAWRESLAQGQIQEATEFSDLEAGLVACGTSVAALTQGAAAPGAGAPAARPAAQPPAADAGALQQFERRAESVVAALDTLRSSNARFAALRQDPDLLAEWASEWKPRLDVSESEYRRLAGDLEQARRAQDLSALETIDAGLQQAVTSITAAEQAARQRIDSLEQDRLAQAAARDEERKRQEALAQQLITAEIREREEAEQRRREREVRERLAVAQRDLRLELDSLGPVLRESRGDDRVRQARTQLSQLVSSGTALLSSESVSDIERQLQRLRDGQRRYDQVVQEWESEQRAIEYRTPPDGLRRIADAYFAGDYETALRLAQPGNFEDPRQVIQAYLFRSAARFNLYYLTGMSDEQLRENARRDIREIKRLDGDFEPYVAAFSPRFVSFFRES